VRFIGLSNTYDVNILRKVVENAAVKPTFLQNRFYADTKHDIEIRAYCDQNNIRYQSFWTLTANPKTIKSTVIKGLAKKYKKTNEQVFYRFVQALGIIPLDGTTSSVHMSEDLDLDSVDLLSSEVDSISSILFKYP
jgi:diketogulonate reductase-like aldo/keto reductase